MNEKLRQQTVFFNGKSMGKSLREVAVDLINTESESVVSRWYHGEMGTDLFTWSDPAHNVIRQQLSFHGQVVEWNCLEGIKTGVVVESDAGPQQPVGEEEPRPLSSETIMFDTAAQSKSVKLALEILEHVNIDERMRYQIIENFKNPQNIETLPPHIFVERFGLALKNFQKPDKGFWENLKSRFQALFNR